MGCRDDGARRQRGGSNRGCDRGAIVDRGKQDRLHFRPIILGGRAITMRLHRGLVLPHFEDQELAGRSGAFEYFKTRHARFLAARFRKRLDDRGALVFRRRHHLDIGHHVGGRILLRADRRRGRRNLWTSTTIATTTRWKSMW